MFFSDKPVRQGRHILLISPDRIVPNPCQPRTRFDQDELLGLAESIFKNGILQPITVRRREDGRFEIIAGERRYRASCMAGLTEIPCIEVHADEQRSAVLALLENLQRSDLSFFEEAEGIARLIHEWGITQEEAASRLGKAQSTLANKLRLLKLTREQRMKILQNNLSERHARALLRLEDEMKREEALDIIIERSLNVAQTEAYIQSLLSPAPQRHEQKITPLIRDVRLFLNTINKALHTMRGSGIAAESLKTEGPEYIEYLIRIPKQSAASPEVRRAASR